MRATGAIRVVIVDDHPMVRQSLRFALQLAADLAVVGEAEHHHQVGREDAS